MNFCDKTDDTNESKDEEEHFGRQYDCGFFSSFFKKVPKFDVEITNIIFKKIKKNKVVGVITNTI